jgi:hypothetical protein
MGARPVVLQIQVAPPPDFPPTPESKGAAWRGERAARQAAENAHFPRVYPAPSGEIRVNPGRPPFF